jgi:hypothetical protein
MACWRIQRMIIRRKYRYRDKRKIMEERGSVIKDVRFLENCKYHNIWMTLAVAVGTLQ